MADHEATADAAFREGLKRILSQTGGLPLRVRGAGPELVILEAEAFEGLVRDATRYRDIVSPEVESGPAMDDSGIRGRIREGEDPGD